MPLARSVALEAAREMLGLSLRQLWVDYVAVGGVLMPGAIDSFLAGLSAIDDHEHDVLVQAMNDHFSDRQQDHPLAYADELAREQS